MPTAAKRPCSGPGCKNLVTSGRCPEHSLSYERARGSSEERGYGRDWRRLRDAFLRKRCESCAERPSANCLACGGTGLENAFCCECMDAGHFERATQADHIWPFHERAYLRLDPRNLQGLCGDCHHAKTLADNGHRDYSTYQQGKRRLTLRELRNR